MSTTTPVAKGTPKTDRQKKRDVLGGEGRSQCEPSNVSREDGRSGLPGPHSPTMSYGLLLAFEAAYIHLLAGCLLNCSCFPETRVDCCHGGADDKDEARNGN